MDNIRLYVNRDRLKCQFDEIILIASLGMDSVPYGRFDCIWTDKDVFNINILRSVLNHESTIHVLVYSWLLINNCINKSLTRGNHTIDIYTKILYDMDIAHPTKRNLYSGFVIVLLLVIFCFCCTYG